jgi:nucleotide-binding universal stress UspA family protein
MSEIVVGVDGSECSAHALRWAAEEADLHGWWLIAAMMWSWIDQRPVQAEAPLFDPHYGQRRASEALEAQLVRELGVKGAANVVRQVECDLPAAGLLRVAADAKLLVVGARGLGGFKRLLLGSVSDHCLHHSVAPIAIIRRPPPSRADTAPRVVVGVDGSPASHRALGWAVDEAAVRHADLVVVHAWQIPTAGELTGFDVGQIEDGARSVLDQALASVDTAGLDRPVERRLPCGHPSAALLEAAEGAGLVVVGARGRGGFSGLLLGSVSRQVAHHVTAPLIVVRDGPLR